MAKPWDELRPDARRGVWRGMNRALHAVLRRLWAPVPAAFRAIGVTASTGLDECLSCGDDKVSPVDRRAVDDERWELRLRCGQCGFRRAATVSSAEARRYERALNAQRLAIKRAVAQMEALRMFEVADCFGEALRLDLIGADDFTRPAVVRRRGPGAIV